jgi:serine/threonine protein kinase
MGNEVSSPHGVSPYPEEPNRRAQEHHQGQDQGRQHAASRQPSRDDIEGVVSERTRPSAFHNNSQNVQNASGHQDLRQKQADLRQAVTSRLPPAAAERSRDDMEKILSESSSGVRSDASSICQGAIDRDQFASSSQRPPAKATAVRSAMSPSQRPRATRGTEPPFPLPRGGSSNAFLPIQQNSYRSTQPSAVSPNFSSEVSQNFSPHMSSQLVPKRDASPVQRHSINSNTPSLGPDVRNSLDGSGVSNANGSVTPSHLRKGHRPSPPTDRETLRKEKEFEKAQEKLERDQAIAFLAAEDRRLDDFYYIRNEVLGKGTFGMVWLADCRRTKTEKFCAIKTVIKEAMPATALAREIQMMQLCAHVNIVRIYDCFKTADDVSMVLEHCAGNDLGSICDQLKSPVEEKLVARWMRQALCAIDYMHNIGLIHRDIKPTNFFLSSASYESPLKLGDFGLAMPYPTAPARANTGDPNVPKLIREKVGTPAFMSPEMHRLPRHSSGYDERVDEWALGVLLVFLLTKQCPFVDPRGKLIKEDLLSAKLPIWETGKLGALFEAVTVSDETDAVKTSKQAKKLCRDLLATDKSERIRVADALNQQWFDDVLTGENLEYDDTPVLAWNDFEDGFLSLEKQFRDIGNKLTGSSQSPGTSSSHPGGSSTHHSSSTYHKQCQKLLAVNSRQNQKKASPECCVCFVKTQLMDHVCPQCRNVVCSTCLPQLKKPECPVCRHDATAVHAVEEKFSTFSGQRRDAREKTVIIQLHFGRILSENVRKIQIRALPKFGVLVPNRKIRFWNLNPKF